MCLANTFFSISLAHYPLFHCCFISKTPVCCLFATDLRLLNGLNVIVAARRRLDFLRLFVPVGHCFLNCHCVNTYVHMGISKMFGVYFAFNWCTTGALLVFFFAFQVHCHYFTVVSSVKHQYFAILRVTPAKRLICDCRIFVPIGMCACCMLNGH